MLQTRRFLVALTCRANSSSFRATKRTSHVAIVFAGVVCSASSIKSKLNRDTGSLSLSIDHAFGSTLDIGCADGYTDSTATFTCEADGNFLGAEGMSTCAGL